MATEHVAGLVAQAQGGDSQAFAALYEQYSVVIFRYLRRRLDGSDESIEDLTADVFVKVFQKLDRYVERGLPFTAWLYRIAHNCLVDHLRALPRHASTSLDDVTERADAYTPSAFGSVLDRDVLEPALATLIPEQRRTVELRFLEGLNVAQTATMMGRSEEAVKKLQARALVNLRKQLAPAGLATQRRRATTLAA